MEVLGFLPVQQSEGGETSSHEKHVDFLGLSRAHIDLVQCKGMVSTLEMKGDS